MHTVHTACKYMCTYQGNLGRTLLASILFGTLLGGALDEKRGSIQFRLRVHSQSEIHMTPPHTRKHARTHEHTHTFTHSLSRSIRRTPHTCTRSAHTRKPLVPETLSRPLTPQEQAPGYLGLFTPLQCARGRRRHVRGSSSWGSRLGRELQRCSGCGVRGSRGCCAPYVVLFHDLLLEIRQGHVEGVEGADYLLCKRHSAARQFECQSNPKPYI